MTFYWMSPELVPANFHLILKRKDAESAKKRGESRELYLWQ